MPVKRKRRKSGCLANLLGILLILILLVAGVVAWALTQPYQGFEKEVFLDFGKGTGSSRMADELSAAAVVRSRWLFLIARAVRPTARLQAGEYRFAEPASVWTVFDRIVRGDVFYYEVTIKEGADIFELAKTVDRLGFIPGADILAAARNPGSIRDLAPDAPSLEGFLFPSTYRLTRRTTAVQLCRQMTDTFRKRWQEAQAGKPQADVLRAVILASLVEKETPLPADRGKVASVYVNRLQKGMKLEADPTTIYAAELEGRYKGVIHRSDLDSQNPYNTYRHTGLPPGPIANPGLASLKAALAPAKTDYLYFVVKPGGEGASNFSRTLSEHHQHVKEYRRDRAQR
jgi:UPF0755 protein